MPLHCTALSFVVAITSEQKRIFSPSFFSSSSSSPLYKHPSLHGHQPSSANNPSDPGTIPEPQAPHWEKRKGEKREENKQLDLRQRTTQYTHRVAPYTRSYYTMPYHTRYILNTNECSQPSTNCIRAKHTGSCFLATRIPYIDPAQTNNTPVHSSPAHPNTQKHSRCGAVRYDQV